jgi:tryptophan synthase alpha subunit
MAYYNLTFKKNNDAFYRHFKKSKTGVIDMSIQDSYVLALLQFFKKRAA